MVPRALSPRIPDNQFAGKGRKRFALLASKLFNCQAIDLALVERGTQYG
jgi:hypothetical protein